MQTETTYNNLTIEEQARRILDALPKDEQFATLIMMQEWPVTHGRPFNLKAWVIQQALAAAYTAPTKGVGR